MTRSSIFNFKTIGLYVVFFLIVFIPIELGLRAWYPYERTEEELFELGAMIRDAKNVQIGFFGNSTIKMLGQENIQRIVSKKFPGTRIENYSISGLSGLNVLKAMQQFQSIPDTCVILISFRDADYDENKLNNSILAIRAGARYYNWDAFTYHVNHILEKTTSKFIFSLGNFPPQRFLGQSAKELRNGNLIMSYKSFFGYHVSKASDNPNDQIHKMDPIEYGRFIFRSRLGRLQVHGENYLNEYLKVCDELKETSKIILVRLPLDEEIDQLERELFNDQFKTLNQYCLQNKIKYFDFNNETYPRFRTKDGIHLSESIIHEFNELMIQTLFDTKVTH